MIEERLDRQVRISGWDQVALSSARVGVIGDDDLLASLFVLSASALGINDLVVLSPRLNRDLVETAARVNPRFNLTHLEGCLTHPALADLFSGSRVVVDLSAYGLANKIALNTAYAQELPLVRAFRSGRGRRSGFKVFTYMRGREWEEVNQLVSRKNLPGKPPDDGILDAAASGIALEEVKNILMGWKVSREIISYNAPHGKKNGRAPRVLVAGAGSLGNFAGLGLAYLGIKDVTFMDPDLIEIANLNRQVFFYDALGRSKAKTLAARLNEKFGTSAEYRTAYFDADTDISAFDAVFDCVDNFETRVLISEKCRLEKKVLISGGTSVTAGQVVVYDPASGGRTPAEILGLYEIVGERALNPPERARASCVYTPNPSVIMTNQVVASLMVDGFRVLLSGGSPRNIFYDSESDGMILK